MPQRILLQPAPREYGTYRVQYDALVKDLEEEGVLVRVSPTGEERGPSGSPANGAESYDLLIQVGEVAGTIVGTATLVETVRRTLRGRGERGVERRRAKIYFASGEEREFSFGDGDE